MGPEVGMKVGEALGSTATYVSSAPNSPMACVVRNELASQGLAVRVEGPDISPHCGAFNMASSNLSASASPAPAAPAPQVAPTLSA
jgi:hypothetical protein